MAILTNTRNPVPVKADPYRLIGILLAFLSALLMAWLLGIGWAYINQSQAAGLPRYESPTYGKGIDMPPAWMQREIVARMKAGNVPGCRAVPMETIRRAAGYGGASFDLWGIANMDDNPVFRLKYGAPVLIWEGLRGRDRHFVLVHEYAHALYGWKH